MFIWICDIAIGTMIAATAVFFLLSALVKRHNSFDKNDLIDGQIHDSFEVEIYFQEDNVPIPESLIYAEETFSVLLQDEEFSSYQINAIPKDSRDLVSCYVPIQSNVQEAPSAEHSSENDSIQAFKPLTTAIQKEGLDDMSRRLVPEKYINPNNKNAPVTPIDEIPTATRPIWEQPSNDDFNDFGGMM